MRGSASSRGASASAMARGAMPGGLGQHHRGIGRHVAMAGIARRLDGDGGGVEAGGQHALGGHRGEASSDERADIGKEVHDKRP